MNNSVFGGPVVNNKLISLRACSHDRYVNISLWECVRKAFVVN